ncbi:hypothetical protein SAMN02746065_12141 [Desulfocicer vacuolatum DSM 3385]|uniref:Nucleoside recognition n=1 Tax=Desulfocicer vacuolatum DSM 3385 TaxID=1121400 RepID=A0A1W2DWJ2_9BACT|nr:hypothetical protein [Desulfocicer vacuolatum]SMD01824.1 hypothetical protein SAMN02746065_12141 [Desulfocicer vacuolatum DSM 3385]
MDSLILSLNTTLDLVFRMGSIMFVSLFGIELFMQMGLMTYLKPIGKPVARLANLPSESAVSFLSAIGSMIAAHSMAAQFHADGKLTDRELILTGVLNTVPFHFKEILTFQLPIVLPLLGMRLCLIYIAAFWLTGCLKLGFVIMAGKFTIAGENLTKDAFKSMTCDPHDPNCVPRTPVQLLKDTWNARKKMFIRMITLLSSVTMVIQILMNTGMLTWLETLIVPMTALLNLPAAVVGPLSAYVFSPTVGITYMSNLLNQQVVTDFQAILSLMAGSLLMIPFTRVRRTLPRYTAIFGLKNGSLICAITTTFSMTARILTVFWLLVFF